MDGDLKTILGTIGHYRDIRIRNMTHARRLEDDAIDAYISGDKRTGDSYVKELSEVYSRMDRASFAIKNALSDLGAKGKIW